jgi:hypothetical protein
MTAFFPLLLWYTLKRCVPAAQWSRELSAAHSGQVASRSLLDFLNSFNTFCIIFDVSVTITVFFPLLLWYALKLCVSAAQWSRELSATHSGQVAARSLLGFRWGGAPTPGPHPQYEPPAAASNPGTAGDKKPFSGGAGVFGGVSGVRNGVTGAPLGVNPVQTGVYGGNGVTDVEMAVSVGPPTPPLTVVAPPFVDTGSPTELSARGRLARAAEVRMKLKCHYHCMTWSVL